MGELGFRRVGHRVVAFNKETGDVSSDKATTEGDGEGSTDVETAAAGTSAKKSRSGRPATLETGEA